MWMEKERENIRMFLCLICSFLCLSGVHCALALAPEDHPGPEKSWAEMRCPNFFVPSPDAWISDHYEFWITRWMVILDISDRDRKRDKKRKLDPPRVIVKLIFTEEGITTIWSCNGVAISLPLQLKFQSGTSDLWSETSSELKFPDFDGQGNLKQQKGTKQWLLEPALVTPNAHIDSVKVSESCSMSLPPTHNPSKATLAIFMNYERSTAHTWRNHNENEKIQGQLTDQVNGSIIKKTRQD